jgi:hypothetical protein
MGSSVILGSLRQVNDLRYWPAKLRGFEHTRETAHAVIQITEST